MSQLLPYLQANQLACHSFTDTGRKTWVFWVRARKQFITHSYSTDQSNISPLFSWAPVPTEQHGEDEALPCMHWHKYRRRTLILGSPDLKAVLLANPRDLLSRESNITFITLEFKSASSLSSLLNIDKHPEKIVWKEYTDKCERSRQNCLPVKPSH